MQIKAIVFDMDDTLYKEKDYVMSGFKAVDRWIKKEYKRRGFYKTATDIFNSGERKLVFNKTLSKLNIEYYPSTIQDMVNIYRDHEPDIYLLEDAEWVFNHLINTTKTGLITDGFLVSQKKKVNALKLEDKVHYIILTDALERGSWKPSPIPYERISKELNCSHNECVYIGDNEEKDFITAKKLGWLTVHIKRSDSIYSNIIIDAKYKAHYEIGDLRDLTNITEIKSCFDL